MNSTGTANIDRVRLTDPEHMNLLGLLMRGLLETNMADEDIFVLAAKLRGDIRVQAGEMVVTLRFDGDGIIILEGEHPHPAASVKGSMADLLGLVSGQRVVGPVATGAIRIGGNPLLLAGTLPILQAPGSRAPFWLAVNAVHRSSVFVGKRVVGAASVRA